MYDKYLVYMNACLDILVLDDNSKKHEQKSALFCFSALYLSDV